MKVTSAILFVLLGFLSIAGEALTENLPPSRPISIGFITDLTGVGSYWGTETRRAAQWAADDLAREGISLKLLFADHQMSPKIALSEAEKMTSINQVDALYVEFSPTAIAAANVAVRTRTLFFALAGSTSQVGFSPFIFKGYLDYEKGCRQIALNLKNRGIKSVGMIKAEMESGELCYREAVSVFPDLQVEQFSNGALDKGHILRLKKKQVEAIMSSCLERDFLTALQTLKELHWPVTIHGAKYSEVTKKARTQFAETLNGSLAFGLKSPDPTFSTHFLTNQPAYANDLNIAALTVLHIKQIARSILACPPKDVTCQSKALAESPADKTLFFRSFNNRVADYESELLRFSDGKFEVVQLY